jgi:GNAT superfamily N-acetyltransferase
VNKELIITPKPEYISWNEITDLLHLAYKERAKEGLFYGAYSQTADKTMQRVGDGICLVALVENKLVGTGMVKFRTKRKKKYSDLCQVGVHPAFKEQGIGTKLRSMCIELCKQYNVNVVYCDTSEKANFVIFWYLKAGWQKVGFLSHRATNYYSIKFRLPVNGRKYSKLELFVRFYTSVFICKLLKREDGEWTALGRIVKKVLRK